MVRLLVSLAFVGDILLIYPQMVGMILLRTVNRDVSRYNAIDLSDDIQEDFGWKLVHAEVFRQPQHPMLLSILNGSGAQFAAMLGVAIFFALLGFLSPSNRGGLSTVMIIFWTLFGCMLHSLDYYK